MRNFICLLGLLLSSAETYAGTIKVAIIDTGLSLQNVVKEDIKLCEDVHNFAGGPDDFTNHGSNVTSIVAKNALDSEYCIVLYKVFNYEKLNYNGYLMALKAVSMRNDIDILNLSIAGLGEDFLETRLLKNILSKKIAIVAAAGNQGINFDTAGCKVYPACADPRILVIGNLNSATSNKGKAVDHVENGNNVEGAGVQLTGTSQAAAIYTGKLIRRLHIELSKYKNK